MSKEFESQRRMVPCAGGDIAVHIQGRDDGVPVILSHSILASSMMWESQMQLLAAQGFRAIAIDVRGHGDSTNAPEGAAAMDDLAADTIAVMDALGIDKAHYIGLSLGGMSGLGLGINHGQRFLSLVLCDARADWPAPAVWEERIEVAKKQGVAALAVPTVTRWFGAAFCDNNAGVAKRFADTISATSIAGFEACARAIQTMNYVSDLGRIKSPVTLIVGGNDLPLPEVMADIQQAIPGARLEIIANAGHLPNIDQSADFNAALTRHFSALA